MTKKLQLIAILSVFSLCTFAQPLQVLHFNLPGAPISTTGGTFFKVLIDTKQLDTATPCDIVLNVSETDQSATQGYSQFGSIVRWKTDQVNLVNPNWYIDLRNGGAYQFNSDNMKVIYGKNNYLYLMYDLTSSPKKYSVYARIEGSTQISTLGQNLQYRVVPNTALNYFDIVYPQTHIADTLNLPTMQLLENTNFPQFTLPTGISITSNPTTITVGQPIQLAATVLPLNANTGIQWKVVQGNTAATITPDGELTLLQDLEIDVEAYAVNMKGSSEIKATKKLNIKSGIKQNELVNSKLKSTSIINGLLQLVSYEFDNKPFTLFDIQGKAIASGKILDEKIFLGNVPNGIYILEINNNDRVKVVKY